MDGPVSVALRFCELGDQRFQRVKGSDFQGASLRPFEGYGSLDRAPGQLAGQGGDGGVCEQVRDGQSNVQLLRGQIEKLSGEYGIPTEVEEVALRADARLWEEGGED